MLQYETLVVTAFAQNCSILWCDQTLEGAVTDPGGDVPRILEIAGRRHIALKQVLITHGHVDHCAAAAELAGQLDIPIVGPHPADQFWIDALPQTAASYGFPPAQSFTPDRWLHDGDRVTVGELELEVYHTPGHTPGHVVFFHRPSKLAIVGDVLFQGSIGRTDFPRGNHQQLIDAITGKLWPLGGETAFVPGHGPMSNFAHERRTNPFVADSVLAR